MRKGFTLIELLVVIAIVAVLAVVVVLVLNPAQLIQQSRDSNRISDMASLNSALGLYLADAGVAGTVNLGSSSVVYVSVPDPSATSTSGDQCQGLGLPTLPLAYSYHCAASSTYRLANATGWIPVSFSTMSNGSPLGQLPIDPINSTSSRLYYTYTTNGSQYEVTAVPESSKYRLGGSSDIISPDGGTLASVFEKGSRLGLEPLDYGDSSLVALWTLDEGVGPIAYDYSGQNSTGTWSGASPYYAAAKIGAYSGSFNISGGDTLVMSNSAILEMNAAASFTLAGWGNTATSTTGQSIIGKRNGTPYYQLRMIGTQSSFAVRDVSNNIAGIIAGPNIIDGSWHYLVGTFNRSTALMTLYVDGSVAGTSSISAIGDLTTGNALHLGDFGGVGQPFIGSIDDIRIYNRALSAAEIVALYNGGK